MREDPETIAAARSWLYDEFVPELRRYHLGITETALELFTLVLCGQVREGLVQSGAALGTMLRRLPVSDIVNLYAVKYGRRTITVNRAIRLLSDLHDRWVSIRDDEIKGSNSGGLDG